MRKIFKTIFELFVIAIIFSILFILMSLMFNGEVKWK